MPQKPRRRGIRSKLTERREKKPLQDIFDSMPVMMMHLDRSGRPLRANREWERMLGWTGMEELFPDPQLREKALEFFSASPGAWRDFPARTRDGRTINVTWSRFPLPDGSCIEVGIDVTERKRTEAERSQLLAQLEAGLAKLRAIESITDALESMTLGDLLRELMLRLREAMKADGMAVLLFDELQKTLTVYVRNGGPLPDITGAPVPLPNALWSRLSADLRPVMLAGPEFEPRSEIREWMSRHVGEFWSLMGVPLISEKKLIGAVVAVSVVPKRFGDDELELLRMIGERVAPTIQRNRLLESARAARERLEALSRRLLSVQEEERRLLAIELHDELGQLLTAVKIDLQAVPPQLRNAIDTVDRALQATRDLSLELRPPMIDDLGLASALRWYGDRFAQQTHVVLRCSIDDISDVPQVVATSCFRVAQEALTNVARHAAAKNVWLDLHRTSRGLELTVRDDGIGFDVVAARERATRGESMGVLGMEERAALLGGTLDIRSSVGEGAEVRASFPIEGAA